MSKIVVPRDVGPSGRALLRGVGAYFETEDLEPDEHEVIILVEAARTADRLEQLRRALADVDLTEPASVRLLAEERQQRAALAHLLTSKLGLPTGSPSTVVTGSTPASRGRQAAANARWGRPVRGA